MASTTTKNILLSQARVGQNESVSLSVLNHTTTQNEDSTVIKIEIPGIDPSTVGINCDDNLLHVECEKGEANITIDPTVDVTKIKADILWGMLTVTIPAPTKPVTQAIKINIHDGLDRKPAPKPHTEKFTAVLEK